MALKNITIKNFQSHKDTVISLHPGVNYCVGSNDSGKSAIMRAINWAIDNSPNGFSFKSHSAKKKDTTSTTLEFENGSITRERSNIINQYNTGEIFAALAGKVPDEISDLINLSEINIQTQYEPYFLLHMTPGKVAEKFNKIFGLQKIDTSLTSIKKIINQTNTDRKYAIESINKLRVDIKDLLWIDDINKDLHILETKEKNNEIKKETINKVETVLADVEKINLTIKKSQKFLKITQIYENLIQLKSNSALLKDKVVAMGTLVSKINESNKAIKKLKDITQFQPVVDALIEKKALAEDVKKKITELEKNLNGIKNIQNKIEIGIVGFEKDVDALIEKKALAEDITKKGKEIANVVREIIATNIKIKAVSNVAQNKEIEYNKMLKNLKICPTCGQSIK